MNRNVRGTVMDSVQEFRLPRYNEIPNVGLYLEQTAKYVSEYLEPLQDVTVTTSMISNYVKKGLVANPVHKQYDRDQIAYLIFIAVVKTVLSMENIGQFLELQKRAYPCDKAYEYFRMELENVVKFVFGCKEELENIGSEDTDEKILLRNTIITVAHKVYLDKCFAEMRRRNAEKQD